MRGANHKQCPLSLGRGQRTIQIGRDLGVARMPEREAARAGALRQVLAGKDVPLRRRVGLRNVVATDPVQQPGKPALSAGAHCACSLALKAWPRRQVVAARPVAGGPL